MWNSQTYGKLELNQIPEKLNIFYEDKKKYGEPIEITIGTDSQNKDGATKIVSVISIICKGHGGIFFHHVVYHKLIDNVRDKLETETDLSIKVAQSLIAQLETEYKTLFKSCPISIHIDAGNSPKGRTKDLIQALTGWVHGMGYNYEVKPKSYAASSIADRLSK